LPAGLKSSLKRGWICNDMTSLRMQWKSWRGFHKMASRIVSYTFTVAIKSVYLHKGTLLKKI
jgi:hypothetical protein